MSWDIKPHIGSLENLNSYIFIPFEIWVTILSFCSEMDIYKIFNLHAKNCVSSLNMWKDILILKEMAKNIIDHDLSYNVTNGTFYETFDDLEKLFEEK